MTSQRKNLVWIIQNSSLAVCYEVTKLNRADGNLLNILVVEVFTEVITHALLGVVEELFHQHHTLARRHLLAFTILGNLIDRTEPNMLHLSIPAEFLRYCKELLKVKLLLGAHGINNLVRMNVFHAVQHATKIGRRI